MMGVLLFCVLVVCAWCVCVWSCCVGVCLWICVSHSVCVLLLSVGVYSCCVMLVFGWLRCLSFEVCLCDLPFVGGCDLRLVLFPVCCL